MILKVRIADSTAGNVFIERQSFITWDSFMMSEVVSNSPDSVSFNIKKYGNKTYEPKIGEELSVEVDDIDVFRGFIVDIDKSADALSNNIKIKCKDYTQILDRILVSKTYTNVTANFIINDLITIFAPGAGFTQNGVVANVIVQKIVFNYLTISQCLTKLAAILGTYEWNINYNKVNLVYNGNQEIAPVLVAPQTTSNRWVDGTATGSTTPTIYKLFSGISGNATVNFDTTEFYSSSKSVKLATTGIGSFIECRTDNSGYNTSNTYGIILLPNTSYTLSYWMKTNLTSGNSNNGAALTILRANAAGTSISENSGSDIKTTTDWTKYTINFISGPTEVLAHLEYRIYGHNGAGNLIMQAWFDDVRLVLNVALKDILFFDTNVMLAPFEINDTGGNFNYSSLNIKRTTTQLKNIITIRGGITEGDMFTDYKIVDGVQKTFFLGYSLTNLTAGLSIGTTIASGFNSLLIGTDGKDSETLFDIMYNSDNGFVRFKDSNVPTINKILKYTGNPRYPLVSQKSDSISIANYGSYEFLIVDKSIKSKAAASQRAGAELLKYSRPQAQVSFTTNTPGLKAGQKIKVNSVNYNINEFFKIINISSAMRSPDTFYYKIDLTLAEDLSLIDLLKKILIDSQSDKIDISDNEIVDRLFSFLENTEFTEAWRFSKGINTIFEIVSFSDGTPVFTINNGTQFVTGPWLPSGPKRQFILNGSPLG